MNKNAFYFLITFIFLFFVAKIYSQESNTQPEGSPQVDNTKSLKENSQVNSFLLFSEKLAELSGADERLWINIDENKNLLLKYISPAKKKRGNILMLHSQSENVLHPRLMEPLTKQLLSLGWNVFIPNLMSEDYPKNIPIIPQTLPLKDTTDESVKSDENKTSESTSENNFQSTEEYQSYYKNLCSGIFEQTKILEQPLLIIANQSSAYWSIECLKITGTVILIVFLQPEIPSEIGNDLK